MSVPVVVESCECCRRLAPGRLHQSILDFRTRQVCWDCIDHNAEPKGLLLARSKAEWRALPTEIKNAITVCHNGRYLTPKEWMLEVQELQRQALEAKQKAEADAVARRQAEDRETLEELDQAKELARKIYSPRTFPASKKPTGWLWIFIGFFWRVPA